MRLRQLFEQEEKVQVILYFEDGTQQVLTDVPRSVTERPNFIDILIRNARDKLSKVVVRYAIGGEEFRVGNRDGRTPDTAMPTVVTGRGEDEIQQRPEEVPQVSTGDPEQRDEPQVTPPPAENEPSRPEPEPERTEPAPTRPQTRPQARPEPQRTEPETSTSEPQRTEPETPPSSADSGGMNVELFYVDKDGYQTDRDGNRLRNSRGEEVRIGTGGVDLPRAGGGQEGSPGNSGASGAEGAITGDQQRAIPSIIEELHDAMSGPGTSEGKLINALRRIESPEHLKAVNQQYRERYGSNLGDDIISEFRYDLGGNRAAQIAEINRETRRIGWEITGSRLSMRWREVPPTSTGNESSSQQRGNSSNGVQATPEEQAQMNEASKIFRHVKDFVNDGGTFADVPSIEYTNADGRTVTLRNPSRTLNLPDKDMDEWTAEDEYNLKVAVARLFPGITAATGNLDDDRYNSERPAGAPMRITVDTGYFVPDRRENS